QGIFYRRRTKEPRLDQIEFSPQLSDDILDSHYKYHPSGFSGEEIFRTEPERDGSADSRSEVYTCSVGWRTKVVGCTLIRTESQRSWQVIWVNIRQGAIYWSGVGEATARSTRIPST